MKHFLSMAEKGRLPDPLIRWGIRLLNRQRLRQERRGGPATRLARKMALIEKLRRSPIAIETGRANFQHYELPTAFFEQVLGQHLKYSGAFWPPGTTALDQAEANMLALTCRRAEIQHGQRILELGSGWGSLSLWIARNYPMSRITTISNSAVQVAFIKQRCVALGLTNLTVIKADAKVFDTPLRFDRVVSVEMFEHMRNWGALLARIAGWLNPGGKLFVHVFTHRSLAYLYQTAADHDWMGRHFFTGGMMPSDDLMLYFQDHLRIERHWRINGRHYGRTAQSWLDNMDRSRSRVMAIMADAYGPRRASLWLQRWRIFFMTCSEFFNTDGGSQWMVSHYLLKKESDEDGVF